MTEKFGIGLMSGTSGDGIDSALVRFHKGGIELKASGFLPYPKKIRDDMARVSRPDGPAELICSLNAELGKLFGKAALELCGKNGIPLEDVDFIGSHGQTIRHQPGNAKGNISSTLQIGESAEIAALTGRTVVSDFRTADIAAGGEGAPLSPMAHYILFRSESEARIIHNLGGISNVTYLPVKGEMEKVWGFDTGPANSLLDLATAHFSKGSDAYDKDGKRALNGEIDEGMFDHCMSHPFFRKKPPKSTGKEIFGEAYFEELLKKFRKVKEADFLRTLSAVTAHSAVRQALKYFQPFYEVRWIVCGGGAFNKALMEELRRALGDRGSVATTADHGIGEKSVESVLMAILAYRTLEGLSGNLPRVTGAKSGAVLGKVTPPPVPR